MQRKGELRFLFAYEAFIPFGGEVVKCGGNPANKPVCCSASWLWYVRRAYGVIRNTEFIEVIKRTRDKVGL